MTGYRDRVGFLAAIVSGLLLVHLAAWAQQPKPGGTLRVAYESDITGLDPHVSFGVQAWHVVGSLFNSLVTIDTQLNFVPDLAESWEILENGKVYVFHEIRLQTFHQDPAPGDGRQPNGIFADVPDLL